MKPRMADTIVELENALCRKQDDVEKLQIELKAANQRVRDLSGENESLRMDKKWLQTIHSCLLQTLRPKNV